jgi:molecular chaperone GrpE (heat shock protein)
LRNALVFLPVLLTWWALREASSLFADSTSQLADGDSANFLVFWQTMSGWSSLPSVALADVVIIGVVIILSLVIGFNDGGGMATRKLEREYASLMVALERDLSGYRYLTVADLNTAADQSMRALANSSIEIENAAKSLALSAGESQKSIVATEEVVVRDFSPIAARLESTVNALASAADIHKDLVTVVQTVQNQFSQELAAVKNGFAGLVKTVEGESQKILQVANSSLSSSISGVSNTMTNSVLVITDNLRTTLKEMSDQSNDISNRFNSQVVKSLEDLAESMAEVSDSMRKTVSTVELGLAKVADDLQHINGRLSRG